MREEEGEKGGSAEARGSCPDRGEPRSQASRLVCAAAGSGSSTKSRRRRPGHEGTETEGTETEGIEGAVHDMPNALATVLGVMPETMHSATFVGLAKLVHKSKVRVEDWPLQVKSIWTVPETEPWAAQ